MKVAVTGASGFLGGHLCEALVERGHEVVALVRRNSDLSVLSKLGVELRYIDLRTGEGLPESLRGIDVVVHLAAYYTFHGKWALYKKINIDGTRAMVEAAKRNGVRHFIYCSTTEVIGPVEDPPADEHTPPNPQYEYGKSKLIAEEIVKDCCRGKDGTRFTILRPSGIYGPRNLDDVSYWTITSFAKRSLPTRFIVGSGKNLIQFVHVKDVTQGFLLAIEKPEISTGKTYIISDDRAYTYEEVYAILSDLCNREPPKIHLPKWIAAALVLPVEVFNRITGRESFLYHVSTVNSVTKDRAYSIEKAKSELGYLPKHDLRTGLRETVDWYVKNGYI
ncbi:MAG: NAD-dependent epimerase/dehydratase family protein [Candidatus Verstraetearchaeota archaeon]|nr:NAD-dependent epimerase/dehydratase family protein [Candidatus Verstraetearchaeota archaeon]